MTFKCDRSASSLTKVLSPDNRSVPSDQVLKMTLSGGQVTFSIESDRLPSAFTSLDSVLSDASLFQEVWLLSRPAGGREGKGD